MTLYSTLMELNDAVHHLLKTLWLNAYRKYISC